MSKNKITLTHNYTNNNMLKNISNVDRIYNVRNNNYKNNVTEIIAKCIVNYDSKKKIVIQNIISNSLTKSTLTPQDVSIIEYIITTIMKSPDIDVLKISTIYFIIDKLFMYNNGNGLRTGLIEQLKAIENKNIKQYLSIYLKTPGSKNNINIEKLIKCTYIQSKTDDSIIFEIVAFMKIDDTECVVLYGKKGEKSLIEVKPLETIDDDFKKYNISSKAKIEPFNIIKALKDKMVSGVEIKAPIRKFTERISNKNTEVYYIYNKSTGDKYKLYDDKDCKKNYDPKCGVNGTSSIVKKSENGTIPSSTLATVSVTTPSSTSISTSLTSSFLNELKAKAKASANARALRPPSFSSPPPVRTLPPTSSSTSSSSSSISEEGKNAKTEENLYNNTLKKYGKLGANKLRSLRDSPPSKSGNNNNNSEPYDPNENN